MIAHSKARLWRKWAEWKATVLFREGVGWSIWGDPDKAMADYTGSVD
jgi:hypothetical protein